MRPLFLISLLAFSSSATAAPLSLTDTLAVVLVGEADGNTRDWAALLWTIKHRAHRAKVSLRKAARYSVVLQQRNPRARRVNSLTTDEPDWGPAPATRRQQWQDAQRFVALFLDGEINDPCSRAMHWRGVNDPIPKKPRVIVSCGVTRNEFFYYYSPKARR